MLSMTCTKGKDKAGKPRQREKKVSAKKGDGPTGLSADLCAAVEKATPEDFAKAYDLAVLTTGAVVVLFAPSDHVVYWMQDRVCPKLTPWGRFAPH